ncbi:MAG TPA: helix-hairpin-helix domain-containing protein, partial [Thermoanaerobaculia bacterium]
MDRRARSGRDRAVRCALGSEPFQISCVRTGGASRRESRRRSRGARRQRQSLSTPGIGKAVGAIIKELVETGQSRYLDELRKQYPPGIFDLLRVPGFGLTKIGLVHEKLGIGSLDELEAAAREGRLAKLRGFGPKTQTKIIEGIEKARRRESQFLLPIGLEAGERMRERLAKIKTVEDAEITGSVRRRLEVIRNVNIAISTRNPD